ncbi:MAG: hypothetical protein M1835_003438 [Candelina submexicana]|nr:MAG: hypothetical protein M1835_003438 [Candelina submexicana]
MVLIEQERVVLALVAVGQKTEQSDVTVVAPHDDDDDELKRSIGLWGPLEVTESLELPPEPSLPPPPPPPGGQNGQMQEEPWSSNPPMPPLHLLYDVSHHHTVKGMIRVTHHFPPGHTIIMAAEIVYWLLLLLVCTIGVVTVVWAVMEARSGKLLFEHDRVIPSTTRVVADCDAMAKASVTEDWPDTDADPVAAAPGCGTELVLKAAGEIIKLEESTSDGAMPEMPDGCGLKYVQVVPAEVLDPDAMVNISDPEAVAFVYRGGAPCAARMTFVNAESITDAGTAVLSAEVVVLRLEASTL